MIEKNMSRVYSVFVSGCYDIIHAGHIQFFKEAKKFGKELIVCIPSDEVLYLYKNRRPSIPIEHKIEILTNLPFVDKVVIGDNIDDVGLNFKDIIEKEAPDILIVTEDDSFKFKKQSLCKQLGIEYKALPKTPPKFEPISTSSIINNILTPNDAPMRVDFAGGWLDVPKYSIPGGLIVNCAISPKVSLTNWLYERQSGLGGSGAWALLNGRDGVASELDLGVGWQDPAVIKETGLCAWESGKLPKLHLKRNVDILEGKMALLYTGKQHDTPGTVDIDRDFNSIKIAGRIAALGVERNDYSLLCKAVDISYETQIDEGMEELISYEKCIAKKYCGGGYGGYGLYMFDTRDDRDIFVNKFDDAMSIEPYIREIL